MTELSPATTDSSAARADLKDLRSSIEARLAARRSKPPSTRMPDLDLSQPLPDRAHEAIRVAVVQAITDGEDSFTLTDVVFQMLDGLLVTVDDLTARLAALEPHPPAPPKP